MGLLRVRQQNWRRVATKPQAKEKGPEPLMRSGPFLENCRFVAKPTISLRSFRLAPNVRSQRMMSNE
jgi:hypothetical protein